MIPHLNAMHAAKVDAGLVVVGVSGEAVDEVEAYVQKNKVEHPIGVGSAEGYDVRAIPHAFLIDVDGKVRWRGHPSTLDNVMLDKLLTAAKPAGVVKGLEAAFALRKQGNHGGAYQKTKELLQAGGLSDAAKAQANDWLRGIEQFVADNMKAARDPAVAKDVYALWQKLDPVANGYAGVPGAETAKARLDALLADSRNKREIEAGRKYDEGKACEAAMNFDAAHAIYKAIASSHSATKAGKAAAASYRSLEKDGKLGYDHRCPYCKAASKACPQHDKKKKKKN